MELHYNSLWGCKGSAIVSPPQPCSLDRNNIHHLTSRPYMVSLKTDGVRKVLFAHHDQRLYWVDRKGAFEPAPGTAVPNIFVGTVLDGELVEREGELTFLVFDCVAITGTQVHNKPLIRRLVHATTACKLIKLEDVGMEVKTTVCATHLNRLLRTPRSHKSDGLVFTPLNAPVEHRGTAKTTLKWKQAHTVDLWLCPSNQHLVFDLLTEERCVTNRITFDEEDPLGVLTNPRLVECQWNGRNFVPIYENGLMKVRHDKPRANTKYVVDRTVKAIVDKVTVDELVEMRYKRC